MAESLIGVLGVLIEGDWSKLQDSLKEAQDAASSGAENIASAFTAKFSDLGEATEKIGTLMAGVFGLELLEPVGKAIGAIGEFGSAMESAELQIISKTGAVGDSLEALKGSFDTVFASVPGDAVQVADALSLISQRLHDTGEDLSGLGAQMTKLADVSGASLPSLADAVTKAFVNWGVATDEQQSKLDLLNSLSQQTGITVQDLAGQLASIGNIARLSGESFDATAQQIATLSSKGIDAQSVFMGIQRAMSTAQKAGEDLSQVTLPNLVFSIEEGIKQGNGLNVALDEFGARAGPKMYELVKDGIISSLDLLNGKAIESTDSINKTFAATDTFSRELSLLGQNIKVFLEPLTTFILGTARDFLKWVNDGITGLQALVYAVTGNHEAMTQLTDAYDKAHPPLAQLGQDLAANKSAADGLSALTNDLGLNLTAVGGAAAKTSPALVDVHAAMLAAKENAALLKQATTDLAQAEAQHAADMKALYVPALMDVGTAQQQVDIYRQEAKLADDNLTTAEAALQALRKSGDNAAILLAEQNLTLARASAKTANENLTQAEKDLNTSKAADNQITKDLEASVRSIAAAESSVHVPAMQSAAQAEAVVAQARANTQFAINAELTAAKALSDFQNQTGIKDATTLKQLEVDYAAAVQNVNLRRGEEKTVITDLNTIKKAQLQTEQDITAGTKLYDAYLKSNVLPNLGDLNTAIAGINDLQIEQAAAAAEVNDAIQAQDDLAQSDTVDVNALADAHLRTKQAEDWLKDSTSDLNAMMSEASRQFGLSQAALDLLTQSAKGGADQAALTQLAYKVLGEQSTQSLQNMATAADVAFQQIRNSGETNSAVLRDAFIKDLDAQEKALAAQGLTLPADQQVALAKMKQQQIDFAKDIQDSWGNLFTSIDTTVKNTSDSMIKTLITGQGSFHDEMIKGLEDIGVAVVEKFTKPFTDAIASLIAGAITNLLGSSGLGGIQSALDGIGKSIGQFFGGGGALGTGVGIGPGGLGAGVPGTPGWTGGAGSTGGSAGGGVGGLLGSITGIAGAIGSIAGAIGTFIEGGATNAKLFTIENDLLGILNYVGARSDGGILGELFRIGDDLQFGYISKQTLEIMNVLDSLHDPLITFLSDIGSNTFWSLQKLSEIDDKIGGSAGGVGGSDPIFAKMEQDLFYILGQVSQVMMPLLGRITTATEYAFDDIHNSIVPLLEKLNVGGGVGSGGVSGGIPIPATAPTLPVVFQQIMTQMPQTEALALGDIMGGVLTIQAMLSRGFMAAAPVPGMPPPSPGPSTGSGTTTQGLSASDLGSHLDKLTSNAGAISNLQNVIANEQAAIDQLKATFGAQTSVLQNLFLSDQSKAQSVKNQENLAKDQLGQLGSIVDADKTQLAYLQGHGASLSDIAAAQQKLLYDTSRYQDLKDQIAALDTQFQDLNQKALDDLSQLSSLQQTDSALLVTAQAQLQTNEAMLLTMQQGASAPPVHVAVHFNGPVVGGQSGMQELTDTIGNAMIDKLRQAGLKV